MYSVRNKYDFGFGDEMLSVVIYKKSAYCTFLFNCGIDRFLFIVDNQLEYKEIKITIYLFV